MQPEVKEPPKPDIAPTVTTASPAQVMDVMASPPTAAEPIAAPAPQGVEQNPIALATAEPARPFVEAPPQAAPDSTAGNPEKPSEQTNKDTATPSPPKPKKSAAPLGVIFVALFVFVALAIVAYMAFAKG